MTGYTYGGTWTAERVEALRRLWGEGHSASAIAAQIGGITRNSVISKAHRCKLPGRVVGPSAMAKRKPKVNPAVKPVAAIKRAPGRTKGATIPPAIIAAQPMPAETPVPLAPVSRNLTVLDLRPGDCRWPHGHPGQPGFGFCGAPSVPGKPYCACHDAIAYSRPEPVRKRRAA